MTEKEILLASILNCPRSGLYTGNLSLDARQRERLSRALSLRSQGVPLQYIIGESEFYGLPFKTDRRALIPRPETEILVETAIRWVTGYGERDAISILDIGTGSGCIAVSLAKALQDYRITALDISYDALTLARENAVLNNVADKIDFIQSDLLSALRCLPPAELRLRRGVFDVIISNPPYVCSGDINTLQKEISYEPRAALDGGRDGLDFYRAIAGSSHKFLSKNGVIFMEMGFNQSRPIKNVFQNTAGFEIIEVVKDYNGIDRVMVARLN